MKRISKYLQTCFPRIRIVHNFDIFLLRTLKSNITCKEEDPSACLPTAPKPIANPFNVSQEDTNCMKFNVSAKGFFSSYTEKVEEGVLEGARSLIFEVGLTE